MEFVIDCQPRLQLTPRFLRRSGQTPVVLYGHSGAESLLLTADTKIVKALLLIAKMNNSLVTVNINKLGLSFQSLLKEVHSDPCSSDIYQVGFFAVDAKKQLTVNVPLTFTGQSRGIVEEDGALDTVLTSLELHCLSGVIPEKITVDISHLKVGDRLHVKDIVLPEGVTSSGAQDRVVVTVLAR